MEVLELSATIVRVGVSVAVFAALLRGYRRTGSYGFLLLAGAVSLMPWIARYIISPAMAELVVWFDPQASRGDRVVAGAAISFPLDLLLVTWSVARFSRDLNPEHR